LGKWEEIRNKGKRGNTQGRGGKGCEGKGSEDKKREKGEKKTSLTPI